MNELKDDFGRESRKVDLELHRVPFFLEPDYRFKPDGWWETHTDRMVRKFGSQEAFDQVKVAHCLMPRAKEAGLDAEGWSDENLDRRRQSSTLRAHRLILWLDETLGWERAETAMEHLHAAHFVHGALLNDHEVLTAAARAAGAEGAAAEAFLRSERLTSAVLGAADAVHAMGIHSIPTLLIDGRPVINGAAGQADVLAALRRAAADATGKRRFDPQAHANG